VLMAESRGRRRSVTIQGWGNEAKALKGPARPLPERIFRPGSTVPDAQESLLL